MLKLVASENELAEWADKYRAGGMGYGTVKKRLAELLLEYFSPYRQKRAELEDNLDYVEKVLEEGAKKARAVASGTLNRARQAVGLGK
jgi:tryptophanyl-tRNA synthetase